MFKPFGYDYDANGKMVGYQGKPVRAYTTCPVHNVQYPSVCFNEDGSLYVVNDKKCPLCYAKEIAEAATRDAKIPLRFRDKTIENYIIKDEWQRPIKAQIVSYAEDIVSNIEKGRCIVMSGGVGTGKTHLSVGLLKEVIAKGGTGIFLSVADLIADIRGTWTGKNVDKVKLFTECDMLVIDEVGVQAGTDNERQILFSVINQRYNDVKPSILLTNLDPSAFKSYVGQRVFDRLKENDGDFIIFNGPSFRG